MSIKHRTSWAFLCLVLGSAAAGCVEPADPDESEAESVGSASSALATCVTIQRGGTGNIADTFLSADYPGWATGGESSLYSGKSSGGGTNRSLLRADLSSIPAGSTVTSATLSLAASWTDANNLVSVHPVLATWSESTTTAANFDAATGIGATAAGSFAAGNGGTKTVDITALAAQWVSGSLANNGVAIQEPSVNSHLFWSSETSLKPSLTVCYEPPPAGPYAWSRSGGVGSIGADAAGNTIGAGPFYGTINFGSGPITSTYTTGQFPTATMDVYVVKFDPAGNALWTKKFGDEYIINPDNARDQDARAVAVDPAGNIYVSGTFKGVMFSVGAPGYSEGSFPHVYTLKVNPSGTAVWANSHPVFGGSADVRKLVVDSQGGAILTGSCPVAVSGYCEYGNYLIKEGLNGGTAWSRACRPTTTNSGRFNALAVDGSGSAILSTVYSQATQGGIDCGAGAVPLQDANDLILAKFDTAGTLTWIKQLPITSGTVQDVVADGANNIYLSVTVTGQLTIGGTTLSTGAYIVKLDQDANFVWSTTSAGSFTRHIALDPTGKIVATGQFSGSVDFGAGPVSGFGGFDTFVWKLSPAGASLSGVVIGGPGTEFDLPFAVDGLGGVALNGSLGSGATFDFGQGAKGPTYIARMSP